MTQPDEITWRLDEIARLLEANGYGVEVHYGSATIIVWTDNWPVVVESRRRPTNTQPMNEEE